MLLNKHTLDNGLKIVHLEDRQTQMVTVNVLYKVGSRNERENQTGFAHLFEHLMFGGTPNVPDYDRQIEMACGNNNAFTTTDYTNYYITLPSANAETAFWLESDRMATLAFTPESLEVQRKVVMEEFKQNHITPPYADIHHIIQDLAYKVHPYRWPTIGLSLDHVANVQMDDVKDFFFRFYAPNNAILTVVGNITFDRVKELSEKWFGKVPMRDIDTTPIPQEPEQTEQRRAVVERKVPNDVLFMSFPIPCVSSKDFHCADMISDILSAGDSCRLYAHLVEEKHLFTTVDAYISPKVDNGQLFIFAMPTDGVTLEEAEDAIWEEIDELLNNGPEEEELEMARNKFETNLMREWAQRQKLASSLAFHEMLGDAARAEKEVESYRSETREHFMEVCHDVLKREKASVLYYKAIKG